MNFSIAILGSFKEGGVSYKFFENKGLPRDLWGNWVFSYSYGRRIMIINAQILGDMMGYGELLIDFDPPKTPGSSMVG